MPSRRSFLEGSVSAVLAALVGRSPSRDQSPSEGADAGSTPTCDACTSLATRQREWLFTPYTEDKRVTFEELMRPENHDWCADCEYQRIADEEDVPFDAADFQEVDYDIESTFHRGTLNVTVEFVKTQPLDVVATTVTVGGDE